MSDIPRNPDNIPRIGKNPLDIIAPRVVVLDEISFNLVKLFEKNRDPHVNILIESLSKTVGIDQFQSIISLYLAGKLEISQIKYVFKSANDIIGLVRSIDALIYVKADSKAPKNELFDVEKKLIRLNESLLNYLEKNIILDIRGLENIWHTYFNDDELIDENGNYHSLSVLGMAGDFVFKKLVLSYLTDLENPVSVLSLYELLFLQISKQVLEKNKNVFADGCFIPFESPDFEINLLIILENSVKNKLPLEGVLEFWSSIVKNPEKYTTISGLYKFALRMVGENTILSIKSIEEKEKSKRVELSDYMKDKKSE